MAIVRFFPLLIPFFVFLMLEFFYFQPQFIYFLLFICPILFFVGSAVIIKRSGRAEKWWNFSILPAYFTVGLILFSLLISSRLLVQLLFFCVFIFLFFYFHIIYNYLVNQDNYKQYSFENISSYGNFLGLYFFYSSLYGLIYFLSIPTWIMVVTILAISGLASYQFFWANGVNYQKRLFYTLINCLVLTQLAWAILFLPLSFYILGFLLSVCYYILIGLSKLYLISKLNKQMVKLYLFYGLAGIILVLLTARWI